MRARFRPFFEPCDDTWSGLRVGIEGKELVIRMGCRRFVECATHDQTSLQGAVISKPVNFIIDVISEMLREEENGQTPIGDFLDKMAYEAYAQGSVWIKLTKETNDEN